MKNEIYLTKDEIKRLIIQSEKLDRLEANGVDNWKLEYLNLTKEIINEKTIK